MKLENSDFCCKNLGCLLRKNTTRIFVVKIRVVVSGNNTARIFVVNIRVGVSGNNTTRIFVVKIRVVYLEITQLGFLW